MSQSEWGDMCRPTLICRLQPGTSIRNDKYYPESTKAYMPRDKNM